MKTNFISICKMRYPIIVFGFIETILLLLKINNMIDTTSFLDFTCIAFFTWAILSGYKSYTKGNLKAAKALVFLGVVQLLSIYLWK